MADIDSNSLNNFVTALNKASKSLGDMQKAMNVATKSAQNAGKAADGAAKTTQDAAKTAAKMTGPTSKVIEDAGKKIKDDFSKDVLAAFSADGKNATKARVAVRDDLYNNLKRGIADTTTSGLGDLAYRFRAKDGYAGAFLGGFISAGNPVGAAAGAPAAGAANGAAGAGTAAADPAKSQDSIAKSTDFLTDLASQAGEKIRGSLGSMLFDTLDGNFKNVGKSFRTMLRQMLADAAASQISKLATGVLGWIGNTVGGLFGMGNTNFSTSWPGQTNAGVLGGGMYNGPGSLNIGWGAAGQFAKGGVFVHGTPVHAFARGGIVNSPMLFPMATGTGLMGEAGPEAIMPLARGPDGRLGVRGGRSSGGGGVNNQISITVNIGANGNAQSDTQAQSDDAGRQLASMVEGKVKEVMAREQRQGGILWRMQHA